MTELNMLIEKIVDASAQYRMLTGRPLGITGQIGEHFVEQLLGLTLLPVRQAGCDAVDNSGKKIQIKTRLIQKTKDKSGSIGKIDLAKEWDTVMLLVLKGNYVPNGIYEATRGKIVQELSVGNSNAKRRGVLSISQFIRIAKPIWPKK